MWFLYLDESGDLGFDFVNKKPSEYFTITILAIQGVENNRKLINSVKQTIKRKLNPREHRKRIVGELKGTSSTIEVKKYFYKQIEKLPFALFSITLNKIKVFERLRRNKERVYNYVARLVLDKIRFENATTQIDLIVDRSKSQKEIAEFNQYVFDQLQGRINPKVILNIEHRTSHIYRGLQSVDVFCWGIFRTYERKDFDWFNVFKGKIKYNEMFL